MRRPQDRMVWVPSFLSGWTPLKTLSILLTARAPGWAAHVSVIAQENWENCYNLLAQARGASTDCERVNYLSYTAWACNLHPFRGHTDMENVLWPINGSDRYLRADWNTQTPFILAPQYPFLWGAVYLTHVGFGNWDLVSQLPGKHMAPSEQVVFSSGCLNVDRDWM